jgi:dolichol-phosphate mannosyltransferase
MTNAFKAYKRQVIDAIVPIRAQYFNITVELPLKALIRNFKYCVVPINWYGRKAGVSKLKIKELGRKYLFTVLSIWLEKILLKDEIREEGLRIGEDD